MDYLEIARQVIANQPDQVQPAVKPQPDGLVKGDVVTIDTADGATLYVVCDEDDVRLLIETNSSVKRGQIWTKSEVQALVGVKDPAIAREIRRLKETIAGELKRERR